MSGLIPHKVSIDGFDGTPYIPSIVWARTFGWGFGEEV
jgi:hypothetical protein